MQQMRLWFLNISGFMLPSYDRTFINTCVSWKKSDGNSGLIGLSVNLEAIISCSDGLASL